MRRLTRCVGWTFAASLVFACGGGGRTDRNRLVSAETASDAGTFAQADAGTTVLDAGTPVTGDAGSPSGSLSDGGMASACDGFRPGTPGVPRSFTSEQMSDEFYNYAGTSDSHGVVYLPLSGYFQSGVMEVVSPQGAPLASLRLPSASSTEGVFE